MFPSIFVKFLGFTLILSSASVAAYPSISNSDAVENRCLQCHGNQPAKIPAAGEIGPELPHTYQMRWNMYEFEASRPPLLNPALIATNVIHGETYYDWSIPAMTEIYRDQCIDIFPIGREYSCQFLSVGSQTYFLRFETSADEPSSCCNWRKEGFWPPRPDVLQNMLRDSRYAEGSWYVLDIPLPGPFGYRVNDGNVPGAFWFPVIGGWVQQEFYDVSLEKPAEAIFEIPQICKGNIPHCSADVDTQRFDSIPRL